MNADELAAAINAAFERGATLLRADMRELAAVIEEQRAARQERNRALLTVLEKLNESVSAVHELVHERLARRFEPEPPTPPRKPQ